MQQNTNFPNLGPKSGKSGLNIFFLVKWIYGLQGRMFVNLHAFNEKAKNLVIQGAYIYVGRKP